jgi:hypothetical protein
MQGDTCFLLNQGDQNIAEFELENRSFGFDSGYVVDSDYGATGFATLCTENVL